jgi:hypothetical protein
MHLVRQRRAGDWPELFERAAAQLKALLRERKPAIR